MFLIDPTTLTERTVTLGRVLEGSEPFIAADFITASKGSLIFVARDEAMLRQMVVDLSYLCPGELILPFPAWDCLPYDRVSPRKDILGERAHTLTMLATRPARAIIITTLSALIQRVPPGLVFQQATLTLEVKKTYALEALSSFLSTYGYQRVGTVHEPGEYAVRGGLVDIFPTSQSIPYRLDFFGDQLESMKGFDPFTQRTTEVRDHLTLYATSEVILTPETIENFRKGYRQRFPKNLADDVFYQAISAGSRYMGSEHWLPLFYESMETIFSYLESATIIFSSNSQEALKNRYGHINEYYTARQEFLHSKKVQGDIYHPLSPDELYIPLIELEEILKRQQSVVHLSVFETSDTINLPVQQTPVFYKDTLSLKQFFKNLLGQGKQVHVGCSTLGSVHRLETQLYAEEFLKFEKVCDWKQALDARPNLLLIHQWKLGKGIATPHHILLSEADLFGEQPRRALQKSRRTDLFIAEASSLGIGDLVVHQEHGIGRFDGLYTVTVNQIPHDCLRLIYSGNDKLFLPVENLELISRYGGEDSLAQLDKLGSAAWQSRKAKVKKRLEEIAEHLIQIAAARELKQADIYNVSRETFDEFSARFAYTETDDQQRAIDETLQSLESGKPMDRLICGDVGFGKTEVALRAAFVVASHGKQVAVITPTTLLCRQHYNNFSARFEGFGMRLEQLSRLVTSTKTKAIKEDLEKGNIRIVIGTHALLSQDIKFMDLGLVIVDEEQHFGVKQKEKLKELQKDVHVLTLTATPIPRTLQMALTGVRDMSIIATPPIDRLAVRTFIAPYDPLIIKEALHRELHRGGQIFYVCPRIKDIPDVLQKLEKIDANIRIGIAHGQMAPRKLEEVMDDFVDRKYDLLLSTNIIESGIDLPTVNTIFVHRSDLFGLAQLYQLRGRIGRGKLRAYAYLTIPPHQLLSTSAQKRLEVMQALDTLGAGFQLASHDMDIRGAGNLLGQEQSGHIREVGVELYQQMLEEAVEHIRQVQKGTSLTEIEERWSPQINFGIPVLIPESYVNDLSVRMELYRRLAHLINTEELQDFESELIDRFGPLPTEVENLLKIMTLKQLCWKAHIDKLDVGDRGLTISFYKNTFPFPDALLLYLQRHKDIARIRPDQKIVLSKTWQTPQECYDLTKKMLEEIGALQ